MTGRVQHPLFDGPVNYRLERLPDHSDSAIARTIQWMDVCRADSQSDLVRRTAEPFLRSTRRATADAVWGFVVRHVAYTPDAVLSGFVSTGIDDAEFEVLIRPVDLLRMRQPAGDCDDFSMLVASMLLALKIPARFVTVAANPKHPDKFSHVYVEAQLESGAWYPLDASHGPGPGYEFDNAHDKRASWGDGMTGLGAVPAVAVGPYGGVFARGPAGGMYIRRPDGTQVFRRADGAYAVRGPGGGVLARGPAGNFFMRAAPAGVSGFPSLGDAGSWADVFKASVPGAIQTAQNIFSMRYGQAPEGTVIQTPGGTYIRGAADPGGFTLAPGVGTGSSGSLLVIALGLGLGVLLLTRGGK